jgi:competence protein ComGC
VQQLSRGGQGNNRPHENCLPQGPPDGLRAPGITCRIDDESVGSCPGSTVQQLIVMESNPPPPLAPQPRTSTAAIWSLVLGILSVVCFSILAGIPAVICGHIAHGKIKHSGGQLTGEGLALGGLITGYLSIALAVFVLPLMLAIAVPNFIKARHVAMQNMCINNLRQIEGAVEAWALENKKTPESPVTFLDIQSYLKTSVACPAGGTYRLTTVSEKPTCSVPGHEIP